MTQAAQPRQHHYVPNFHVKRWGLGKKNTVHVFEKSSRRSWPARAKDVARERDYYTFRVGQETITYEDRLSRVESAAAPIIEKLISRASISALDETDRATLCLFLSLQFVRTPAARNMRREAIASMSDQIIRRCAPADITEAEIAAAINETFGELGDDTADAVDLDSAPESYAAAFSRGKDWFLLRTRLKNPFLLGDHPVVLQNSTATDHPIFGNIGLSCKGIEIYFPLSPTLTLAIFCDSHLDDKVAAATPFLLLAERLRQSRYTFLDARSAAFLEAAETGKPIDCEPGNIENLNYLQIVHAERHVFSLTSDWRLVNRVLDSSPSYTKGRRLQVR